MTKAIQIQQHGDASVLQWRTVNVGAPSPDEVRIKHHAIGLNFIDIYHRSGLYPLPLPSGLGLEGAGEVTAIGDNVSDFQIGDRVAYASPPIGAYAESRLMPAQRLVKLPDTIDYQTAAAMMLQGMTAHYLIRRSYRVKAGDTVLFHAAAGGVGLIACQWLKHLGATVIGTVGSPAKAELAKAHGCDHTILYNKQDVAVEVREITAGAGVPVVYDSVGKATWQGSLDSLAKLGMLVSFGNASGPVDAFAPATLASKGSLFLTRPTLMDYTAKREDLLSSAEELFAVVSSGAVNINIHQTYPLAEAAQAQRDLEARKTTGSSLLLP